MKILVLNAGSSSIKYTLYKFPSKKCLLDGSIEKIGEPHAYHHYQIKHKPASQHKLHFISHKEALHCIIETLEEMELSLKHLHVIAHRVVHGGKNFQSPTLIKKNIIAELKKLIPLAPLHNPSNILGIEMMLELAPKTKQVAVFDTAFHHSLPEYAYRYPIPEDWYQQHHVRRYGFHGTSHAYVAKQAAQMLNKPLSELNLISLHLGNGASACAIAKGKSIDTSMGFTPLEGLMMGSRCGDIDPTLYPYLTEHCHLSINAIHKVMNQESGLKGMTGTNDMREIHHLIAKGDSQAKLAFDMYCYRIKKYIGAYYAVLGKVDALIFTGGIGENDAKLRAKCCANLQNLGIEIHPKKNQTANGQMRFINSSNQKTAILVIKTNEALEIAQQAVSLLEDTD